MSSNGPPPATAQVWYGVPASAGEQFDAAMRDAVPHLFAEDPLLLHRLVTHMSPAELRRRGVPVHRWGRRVGHGHGLMAE